LWHLSSSAPTLSSFFVDTAHDEAGGGEPASVGVPLHTSEDSLWSASTSTTLRNALLKVGQMMTGIEHENDFVVQTLFARIERFLASPPKPVEWKK